MNYDQPKIDGSDDIVCSDQYHGLHWRISSGEGGPTGGNEGHDLGGSLAKITTNYQFY